MLNTRSIQCSSSSCGANNESGQAAAPVTVSVHGTVLAGDLIAQRTFFGELVAGHP